MTFSLCSTVSLYTEGTPAIADFIIFLIFLKYFLFSNSLGLLAVLVFPFTHEGQTDSIPTFDQVYWAQYKVLDLVFFL